MSTPSLESEKRPPAERKLKQTVGGRQVLLDSELSEIRDRERGWAEAMAERGTRTAKWLMSAQKGGE